MLMFADVLQKTVDRIMKAVVLVTNNAGGALELKALSAERLPPLHKHS